MTLQDIQWDMILGGFGLFLFGAVTVGPTQLFGFIEAGYFARSGESPLGSHEESLDFRGFVFPPPLSLSAS